MDTFTEKKKITYSEYRNFESEDNFWYELLNGRLVKKASPSPKHQMISGELFAAMRSHVKKYSPGSVFYAPIDVFIDEHNAPQPDLVFVSNKKKDLITNDDIMGPPDLVVEIISPSSILRDRFEKKELYEGAGIPEFWLVDPANQSVEVYLLKKSGYVLLSSGSAGTGKVASKVIEDLEVKLEDLFS